MIAQRELWILLLLLFYLIACETRRASFNKGDCDFEFQIETTYGDIYQYESQTGKLRKLIQPKEHNDLADIYADTVLWLTKESICRLEELCILGNLKDFPDNFTQSIDDKGSAGPSNKFSFSRNGATKTIVWKDDTRQLSTEDTKLFAQILTTIDSLVTTSKEFKALPERKYIWE